MAKSGGGVKSRVSFYFMEHSEGGSFRR